MREDAPHVVRDRAHDEAVEQRDLALGTGPGDDPARRQKAEIVHRVVEPRGPEIRVRLDGGDGTRDAAPAILDRPVERLAGRSPEPVLHVPDLLRDRRDRDHPPYLPPKTGPAKTGPGDYARRPFANKRSFSVLIAGCRPALLYGRVCR